jgi:hypothetical protein
VPRSPLKQASAAQHSTASSLPPRNLAWSMATPRAGCPERIPVGARRSKAAWQEPTQPRTPRASAPHRTAIDQGTAWLRHQGKSLTKRSASEASWGQGESKSLNEVDGDAWLVVYTTRQDWRQTRTDVVQVHTGVQPAWQEVVVGVSPTGPI